MHISYFERYRLDRSKVQYEGRSVSEKEAQLIYTDAKFFLKDIKRHLKI